MESTVLKDQLLYNSLNNCFLSVYGHVIPVEPSVAGDSWCGHHSCLFVCYVGFYL